MGNCFINWDAKGSKDQSNNASLDELGNLSHLRTLDIMIQDVSVLPRDMQVFAKLERYNIYVGDIWKWPLEWSGNASETSRNLKLTDNSICAFKTVLNCSTSSTQWGWFILILLYPT
ncbi:disease resistance protein [Trifolium pratense]|uniref:Disease resistance protein n=1 Tax=Trifolium pratense TaxID=57577 RepID=A0A2K3KX96_TRIPR|nr:disease resistance protein [Trifolium pratense]